MVIEIPAFLFARSTGETSAAGEAGDEIGRALAAARSSEREILSLSVGLGLVGDALKGGGKARQQLAAARRALGPQAESGAFRWLLEHSESELSRRETASARGAAARSLMGAVKAVATLPVDFAGKAEVGRTLLQQGIQRGLIAAEDRALYESALRSELVLRQAQTAIAQAVEPGAALRIAAAAQSDGALLPSDGELLGRQAQERDAVAAARNRARLAWKETEDLAAFGRGEIPAPLSEESFALIHGARGAPAAYARYQAAREAAEAMSPIRGRDAQAIATERASWTGTPAAFDTAVQNDEAWKRRDPAGYALATVQGAATAWDEAPEEQRGALLWWAQGAAGIPEDRRSPWTLAQEQAMADEWDALAPGSRGGIGRLAFLQRYVLGLPEQMQASAIRRLIQQGITDGTEAELAAAVDRAKSGRTNPARLLLQSLSAVSQAPSTGSGTDASLPGAAVSISEVEKRAEGPSDWRSTGAPNPDEPIGAWEREAYSPADREQLGNLFTNLLAFSESAEIEATVNAYNAAQRSGQVWSAPPAGETERSLRERIAGLDDPWLAARLTSILDAVVDPASDHNVVFAAREELLALVDRVERGLPYDKGLAQSRDGLVAFERVTGIKARPAGPGMVALLPPGAAEPIPAPLALVTALADEPEKLGLLVSILDKQARGVDATAELSQLEQALTKRSRIYSRNGVAGEFLDRGRWDNAVIAFDAVKARLAEGVPPSELLPDLAQVVLDEELRGSDLAALTVELVIGLMPLGDLVDLARGGADLVDALLRGDRDAAAAAGLATAITTLGLIPGVGKFLQRGLRWAGEGLGIVQSAAARALERLTSKSERLPEATSTPGSQQSGSLVSDPPLSTHGADNATLKPQVSEESHGAALADPGTDRPTDVIDQTAADAAKPHQDGPSTPDAKVPRGLERHDELAATPEQVEIDLTDRSAEFADDTANFKDMQERGGRAGASITSTKYLPQEALDAMAKDPKLRGSVFGVIRQVTGWVGEKVVRPVANAELRRLGLKPQPSETWVRFHQAPDFKADIVGIRIGADRIAPTAFAPKDVIWLKLNGEWVAYNAKDIRLLDAKFGKGRLEPRTQRPADKALRDAGHSGIEKLNPSFEQIAPHLAAALNDTNLFRKNGFKVSPAVLISIARSLPKGKDTLAAVVAMVMVRANREFQPADEENTL